MEQNVPIVPKSSRKLALFFSISVSILVSLPCCEANAVISVTTDITERLKNVTCTGLSDPDNSTCQLWDPLTHEMVPDCVHYVECQLKFIYETVSGFGQQLAEICKIEKIQMEFQAHLEKNVPANHLNNILQSKDFENASENLNINFYEFLRMRRIEHNIGASSL